MIDLYCGISETRWNYHAVKPGPLACISPVKGATRRTLAENRVYVPDGTLVLQDSGAFQDSINHRLSFEAALERQINHAGKWDYTDKLQYRASYDLLIDEVWQDGQRHKQRWSVADAEYAVNETVAAAAFLDQHRYDIDLVLSAQGVDAKQYLYCAERVIPYLATDDMLGLGGWCIVGKMPKRMMTVFADAVTLVIPYAARHGVKRVHIWGVTYPVALGQLLYICDEHGIELSTDSASPTMKPIYGEWGYGEWIDKSYQRAEPAMRGVHRMRHVEQTREWLRTFRDTVWYKPPQYVSHRTQYSLPFLAPATAPEEE